MLTLLGHYKFDKRSSRKTTVMTLITTMTYVLMDNFCPCLYLSVTGVTNNISIKYSSLILLIPTFILLWS